MAAPVLPAVRASTRSGLAPQAKARAASTATFVANSVVWGAIRSTASRPIEAPNARRATRPSGTVFGSVIMKKRNTRISGENTRIRHSSESVIGPRCQRAVIAWSVAASTAIPAANTSQKPIATPIKRSRRRIAKPPATIRVRASASHTDIGPHQKSRGSARDEPRTRKHTTRPKLDGLKTWRPRKRIRYLESSEIAAVPAKIHHPCMLHQSPCSVPGTRRMNATPFPVSMALAGHMITCCRRNTIATSSTAQVRSETRICAIDNLKSNATCPRTWSEMMTPARCRRGSRREGSSTG